MTNGPTVVMYSPDTIGLGHIRRHSSIAAELVSHAPGANVVMLIGTGNGAFFELPQGVDSIKIPSVLKTGSDTWRARSLDFSSETTRRIRSGIVRETLDTLRPDVFLVDHLPAGIWRELVPVLGFLKEHSPQTKIVLGLRDILDEEHHVRRRWEADRTYDLIKDYYDSIFIYGDNAIFPSAQRYGLDDSVCDDVRYMGYIGPRSAPPLSPQAAAETLGLARTPGSKLMVVTAGGGFDAYPMMSAVLDALEVTVPAERPDTIMISGPLMPMDQRTMLTERSKSLRTTVVPFTSNMRAFLAAADLVVTMGGYNSMIETMATGKPTINIPRSGPSQEQTLRARLFQEMGLLRHVPLASAEASSLAAALAEEIQRPVRASAAVLPLDGARRAAHHLATMFGRNRRHVRHDSARQDMHDNGAMPHVAVR